MLIAMECACYIQISCYSHYLICFTRISLAFFPHWLLSGFHSIALSALLSGLLRFSSVLLPSISQEWYLSAQSTSPVMLRFLTNHLFQYYFILAIVCTNVMLGSSCECTAGAYIFLSPIAAFKAFYCSGGMGQNTSHSGISYTSESSLFTPWP